MLVLAPGQSSAYTIMPFGYHPVAASGYDVHHLWFLAGETHQRRLHDHPALAWVKTGELAPRAFPE
jgi:5-deoxy-D-glucuronate isomerase